MSAPPFFQSAERGNLLSALKKKNHCDGSHMGEPIRTRKDKSAGKGKHDARLNRVVQVKRGEGNPLI